MSDDQASGRLGGTAGSPHGEGDPGFPWRGPEVPGPWQPGQPSPGRPGPGGPWQPGPPSPGPVPPTRILFSPPAERRDPALDERLLARRIVLASGLLDEAAASRLSAQLLTLDAEGDGPVRLQLQNLQADLPAALTIMGVLDVVRAEVQAFASGETGGPAVGVLASCPRRLAYPHASFTLSEPRLHFGGTVAAVTAREQQVNRMTDSLYYRIAEAAGRDADEVREDARQGRVLTVAEAIGYGLIHDRAATRQDHPNRG
jgi:ATP-dependent Clp protease, protease subunit